MSTAQATGPMSHPYNGVLNRIQRDENELAEMEAQNKNEQEVENPQVDENTLGAEEQTFRKRYGDLRRYMQQKQKEHDEEKQELVSRLREVTAQKFELPKTEAELQEFANDYPDLFALIETAILRRTQQAKEEIEASMENLKKEQAYTRMERANIALTKEHPDINSIRQDEKFHEWASTQSKMIRDALYNNIDDWQACSDAIYLYKAYVARTNKPTTKNNELGAAGTVKTGGATTKVTAPTNTGGKKRWKESEIKNLSAREAERLWPEIEAAINAGDIEYDITGAAM